MTNQNYQQINQKTIETLKAARNQVMQADKTGSSVDSMAEGHNPYPKQSHNKFAEEFIQKLDSIEQEKMAVDEEIVGVEKLWSGLVEKKKLLENRRSELIKVKDRLKELDKEMSTVLGK